MSLLSFSLIIKAVLAIIVILVAYVYLRHPINQTIAGAETAITKIGGALENIAGVFEFFNPQDTATTRQQERSQEYTDENSTNEQTNTNTNTSQNTNTSSFDPYQAVADFLNNAANNAQEAISNLIPEAYGQELPLIRDPQFDHVDEYYAHLARQQAQNQEANFFGANNANVTLTASNSSIPQTQINASPQGSISEISFDKSGKATSIFYDTLNRFVANQNAPARQEYSSSRQNNANFTAAIRRVDNFNKNHSSNLVGTPAQHKQAFNSRKATQADKDREATRALDRAKSLYGENYGATNF